MPGTCKRWTHKIHYSCIGVCACIQGGRQCKDTLHNNNKMTSILHTFWVYILHMIHAPFVYLSIWCQFLCDFRWKTTHVCNRCIYVYVYVCTYMLLPNTCLKELDYNLETWEKKFVSNYTCNVPAERSSHARFAILKYAYEDAIFPHLIYTGSMSVTVSVHLRHNRGCHWHSVCSRLEIRHPCQLYMCT